MPVERWVLAEVAPVLSSSAVAISRWMTTVSVPPTVTAVVAPPVPIAIKGLFEAIAVASASTVATLAMSAANGVAPVAVAASF